MIEHYKVITNPMHFCKMKFHKMIVSYLFGFLNR